MMKSARFNLSYLRDKKVKEVAIQGDRSLNVHAEKVKTSPDLELEDIAALTPSFTGADLANLVNEAALAATRRNAEDVTRDDFTTAIERIVAGLERKNRLLNEAERTVVAHHEMGHALVAASLPGMDAVHKVSIIPRGIGALGYTMQRPTDDRYLMTRAELESKMTVLRGAFPSTSPMVLPRQHSDETVREIDEAVRDLVQQAFDRARRILIANGKLLDESANQLLAQESLDDDDLKPLFARLERLPSESARPARMPHELPKEVA